jgi:NADH dehydrogenase
MPVVVIGADTPVGRGLVPILRQRGSEVRATIREAEKADPLRALGAKVAADPASDADMLRAILDEAHTVCLVSADLFPQGEESYEETIVEGTRTVLRVARKAGVTRLLLVSYPGVSSTSPNEFLRSMGLAEDAVRDSGLEHTILRCTHIYGPESAWLEFMVEASRQRPALVVGPGTQRLAPVFSDDVARALAGADDRAVPVSGTYGIQGPDVVTADELADLLGPPGGPKRHVRGASLPDSLGSVGRRATRWSRTIGEILAADCLADSPDANDEFGLEPTPLAAGLAEVGIG